MVKVRGRAMGGVQEPGTDEDEMEMRGACRVIIIGNIVHEAAGIYQIGHNCG